MFRSFAIIALAVLVAEFAACGGEDGGARSTATGSPDLTNASTVVPVTPVAKPAGVPEPASAVEQTTELGRFERRAGAPPERIDTRELRDASCEDDLIVLETSRETIYAPLPPVDEALPCDRFWGEDEKARFVGQDVAITLEVTATRFRLLVETVAQDQAEFTAGGIWVE